MFGRQRRRKQRPITKRRFFLEFLGGCTVYCFFAWYMLAYTALKQKNSGSDTLDFSLVFFGSIIVYAAMAAVGWFLGKKRFPEWLMKDAGILGGVWLGGVASGLLVFVILAKL